MIDRPTLEAALVGGVIVRRAFKRVAAIVSEESFRSSNNRAIYGFARNLAICGLDADDEYVLHVADAVRFAGLTTKHIERAMLAFCDVADARPDWKLEDLARAVRDGETDNADEATAGALVRSAPVFDLHPRRLLGRIST